MNTGFNNELFRKCFGRVNVPRLCDASNMCLTTYVEFLQDKLLEAEKRHSLTNDALDNPM